MGAGVFRRESILRDEVWKLDGGQSMKVLTCKSNEFGMSPKCYWSHWKIFGRKERCLNLYLRYIYPSCLWTIFWKPEIGRRPSRKWYRFDQFKAHTEKNPVEWEDVSGWLGVRASEELRMTHRGPGLGNRQTVVLGTGSIIHKDQ